jgi:hypothetical protein
MTSAECGDDEHDGRDRDLRAFLEMLSHGVRSNAFGEKMRARDQRDVDLGSHTSSGCVSPNFEVKRHGTSEIV